MAGSRRGEAIRRSWYKPQPLTLFAERGAAAESGLTLTVAAKRLPPSKRRQQDLLIVVTNRPRINALSLYRKRWAIESLFGDTKTRGLRAGWVLMEPKSIGKRGRALARGSDFRFFANPSRLNIEDTKLTDPRKLDILMAVVAIATAWASRTAAILTGTSAIPRKKHGYPAKSRFRIGFDALRNMLRSPHHDPTQIALNLNKSLGVV